MFQILVERLDRFSQALMAGPTSSRYTAHSAAHSSRSFICGFSGSGCQLWTVSCPNMARIAEKGVKFGNFHTTALCSPTRASLLTGRNATSNGMATIAEFASTYAADF